MQHTKVFMFFFWYTLFCPFSCHKKTYLCVIYAERSLWSNRVTIYDFRYIQGKGTDHASDADGNRPTDCGR